MSEETNIDGNHDARRELAPGQLTPAQTGYGAAELAAPAAVADPFRELFGDLDEEVVEAEVPPLTGGWMVAVVVIGVLAATLALSGMVFAFHSVSSEMAQVPSIGPRWAYLVPLIADIGIFVFSGVDIVLQRAAMPHPLARWMVYALTGATIAMNLAADGADGRLAWLLRAGAIVAHVTGPLAWVVFVETLRHAVRVKMLKATRSMREPIPFARWVTAPLPTFKLWRRMVMWGEINYRKALRRDLYRLEAIGVARRELGWFWRWKITPDVRLRMTLGLTDASAVRRAVRPQDGPGLDQQPAALLATAPAAPTPPHPRHESSTVDWDGIERELTAPERPAPVAGRVQESELLAAAREVERWRGMPSASRISRELGIGMPLATSLAYALSDEERAPAGRRGDTDTPGAGDGYTGDGYVSESGRGDTQTDTRHGDGDGDGYAAVSGVSAAPRADGDTGADTRGGYVSEPTGAGAETVGGYGARPWLADADTRLGDTGDGRADTASATVTPLLRGVSRGVSAHVSGALGAGRGYVSGSLAEDADTQVGYVPRSRRGDADTPGGYSGDARVSALPGRGYTQTETPGGGSVPADTRSGMSAETAAAIRALVTETDARWSPETATIARELVAEWRGAGQKVTARLLLPEVRRRGGAVSSDYASALYRYAISPDQPSEDDLADENQASD